MGIKFLRREVYPGLSRRCPCNPHGPYKLEVRLREREVLTEAVMRPPAEGCRRPLTPAEMRERRFCPRVSGRSAVLLTP